MLTLVQAGGFYGVPGMFAPEHVRAVCAGPELFFRSLRAFYKSRLLIKFLRSLLPLFDVSGDQC